MAKKYEEIREIIIAKMREMSQYDSFESFIVSYKPTNSENSYISIAGGIDPIIDLSIKTVRLVMDNLKEIDTGATEKEIAEYLVAKVLESRLVDLQSEIRSDNLFKEMPE